jgi:hypothetical protein
MTRQRWMTAAVEKLWTLHSRFIDLPAGGGLPYEKSKQQQQQATTSNM